VSPGRPCHPDIQLGSACGSTRSCADIKRGGVSASMRPDCACCGASKEGDPLPDQFCIGGCCDCCPVIQLGRLPGSIKLAAENGACASPGKYEPLPGPCAAGWFSCTQEGRDAESTSELAENPLGGGIPASVFGAGIEDGRGAPY